MTAEYMNASVMSRGRRPWTVCMKKFSVYFGYGNCWKRKCIVNHMFDRWERERESRLAAQCWGGGGGKVFAGLKGRRDGWHCRLKIVPPQLKLGFWDFLSLAIEMRLWDFQGYKYMHLLGMLALPYLKARIKNFKANGGEIQDQKYARDVRCQK